MDCLFYAIISFLKNPNPNLIALTGASGIGKISTKYSTNPLWCRMELIYSEVAQRNGEGRSRSKQTCTKLMDTILDTPEQSWEPGGSHSRGDQNLQSEVSLDTKAGFPRIRFSHLSPPTGCCCVPIAQTISFPLTCAASN